MPTDCNHNKLQNAPSNAKPLLLDPWESDDFKWTESRPRSYSIGCHPATKEIKGLFSKRGLPPSSLEITLGSINSFPKRKSSDGYLKQSLLALFIICMIFIILLYGYYNVRINNFELSSQDRSEQTKIVPIEQIDIPALTEEPAEDMKILEEMDEMIPQHQRLPRETPRESNHEKSLPHQVYVSVTQENADSQHQGHLNSRMQHSYRHQGPNYGHSFVQRHHHPRQHTGVYYAQPHLHVNRIQAGNIRAFHNELAMARQSWLVEYMRHQQPGRASSYIWEAPANKPNKHLVQVSSNKATEIEKDRIENLVKSEENNFSNIGEQTTHQ